MSATLALMFLAPWLGAATPTAVAVVPSTGPDGAYVLRYSQAALVRAVLIDTAGPIAGERVTFVLTDVATSESFVVDDPLTDATGTAVARITFVDGRHGGQSFVAADASADAPGHPYIVTARFLGDVDEDDPACAQGDAGVVDGGDGLRCASSADGALFLQRENVALAIAPGNVVGLGEEVTLAATLEDESGDAPVAGTDIDGASALPVADVEVAFFFDLNLNERPEADELVGRGTTNASGIARVTFVVDPSVFPAGDFANGLQAQFGGDDRYALAGATGRITVVGGAPVPANTVIEADPEVAPADGDARIALKAILVDEGQNPLGPEAPPVSVRFTSTLGTVLEEEALYDVLTGHYTQEVRAPTEGGEATITVVVDGVEGATRTVTFVDEGCACAGASTGGDPFTTTTVALVLLAVVRRRGARGTRDSTPDDPRPARDHER